MHAKHLYIPHLARPLSAKGCTGCMLGARCCMEDCSGGLLERVAQHGSQKDCSEGAQNDAQSGAQMVCSNGSHIPHTRVSSVGCMESGWAQGWHSGVLVGNLHTTWQGLQAIVRVLVRWNGLARGDSGSRGRCAELCVHCWPHGLCWWKTTWLESHVPHVAGARIHASSARLVWDVAACGACGAFAARGRARGVAG